MKVSSRLRLVLLGTGTPNAEPERAGSALAIIAGERPYLVDFGPGVVRRAQTACHAGEAALAPANIRHAFLTHLHSDHTAGYPDLMLTPWTLGRDEPLRVFGPPGTHAMTEHLQAAYQADLDERIHGLEPANESGHTVEVQEIEAGLVYQDDHVSVSAFAVQHGAWPAFGFRFEADRQTVVISGDTAPFDGLADHYLDADILVHEVYSEAGFERHPPEWQAYHAAVHTSTRQLAAIANQVRPRLLVLVHQLYWGVSDEELLAEIHRDYNGDVVSGKDLDFFGIGD